MPATFSSLIVILVLAISVFVIAHRTVCAISKVEDFTRRRNLWFGLTLGAFLAPNFWAYAFIAILLLLYANRRETNPPALFFFVLFAIPAATVVIPGLGLVSYLFLLSYPRILELFVLLPAFFRLIQKSDTISFGKTGTDKVLIAYLLLTVALYLRDTTLTDTLRQSLYLFLDVFLPYFVISRSLKNLQGFKDALLSFVIAIMLLALIAVFEAVKYWPLYGALNAAFDFHHVKLGFLERGGVLRAMASAGQPIVLGYLLAVGMGFYLFLQRSFPQKLIRQLGIALLVAGLLATVSRGPWVGCVVLLIAFIATGQNPARRLTSIALMGMLALPLIAILPVGEKIINLLPFVGSTESSNIDYRAELFRTSILVIQRHPWFGNVNFLEAPEMEALRNGSEGIIDVVNSYLEIVLTQGLIGLGLFVGVFLLILLSIYRAMRLIPDKNCEEYLLGRALLATLISIMVIIFTVSSISFIPIVYWSVAGLGFAYAQMVRKQVGTNPASGTSH